MRRIFYSLLLIGRLCLLTSPGYIHPDEFFQSGQELFFRIHHHHKQHDNDNTPWEWLPTHAIRSIVQPIVLCQIPMYVYACIRGLAARLGILTIPYAVSGMEVLIVPRVFLALLSFLGIDICIAHILRHQRQLNITQDKCIVTLLHLASSWAMLLLVTRPFTNSLETIFVSLLLYLAIQDYHMNNYSTYTSTPNHLRTKRWNRFQLEFLLGILCAVAVFTRFTFLFFAIAIVSTILIQRFYTFFHLNDAASRIMCDKRDLIGLHKLRCIIYKCVPFISIISFLLTSSMIILLDTLYYNNIIISNNPRLDDDTSNRRLRLVFTPINFFRYNSNYNNLLQHGIHPRITHLVVNLPLLFGPLVVPFWRTLIALIIKKLKASRNYHHSRDNENFSSQYESIQTTESNLKKYIQKLSLGTIITSLGLLSCSPHQEPRFLMPLITPLVLLYALEDEEQKNPSHNDYSLLLSLAFNGIMVLFYGFFHQAGVIPSLLAFSNNQINRFDGENNGSNNSCLIQSQIIYFHTYMPPTFLLRSIMQHQSTNHTSYQNHKSILIQDLKGSTLKELKHVLLNSFTTSDNHHITDTCARNSYGANQQVFLVAPSFVVHRYDNSNNAGSLTNTDCSLIDDAKIRCKSLWSYHQFSGEDLPNFHSSWRDIFDSLRLVIYQVEYLN